jgi:predicted RNase H-like HicB family nuclease
VKFRVLLHKAEESGWWAEVPALPSCFTQGETKAEVLENLREATACHLDEGEVKVPEGAELQEVEL